MRSLESPWAEPVLAFFCRTVSIRGAPAGLCCIITQARGRTATLTPCERVWPGLTGRALRLGRHWYQGLGRLVPVSGSGGAVVVHCRWTRQSQASRASSRSLRSEWARDVTALEGGIRPRPRVGLVDGGLQEEEGWLSGVVACRLSRRKAVHSRPGACEARWQKQEGSPGFSSFRVPAGNRTRCEELCRGPVFRIPSCDPGTLPLWVEQQPQDQVHAHAGSRAGGLISGSSLAACWPSCAHKLW